ncbi:MAG: toll/interleukin-1 receptor domain-containing protein [Hyphomicrobiaceae bacterium]
MGIVKREPAPAKAGDNAGNLLTDVRSGVTTAYTYNKRNRLATVTVGGNLKGTYTYNAGEQLVKRVLTNMTPSGTTHFVHDLMGNVIAETNGVATGTVRAYIWLPETEIAPDPALLVLVHDERPSFLSPRLDQYEDPADLSPPGLVCGQRPLQSLRDSAISSWAWPSERNAVSLRRLCAPLWCGLAGGHSRRHAPILRHPRGARHPSRRRHDCARRRAARVRPLGGGLGVARTRSRAGRGAARAFGLWARREPCEGGKPNSGAAMTKIFLSYARPQSETARQLAEILSANGHEVWWDHNLAVGSVFSEKIRSEIEAADDVIVIWSADAVASPWVLDEAGLARDLGKLKPIRVDDCEIPLGFKAIHTIDFRGSQSELDDVLAAVKTQPRFSEARSRSARRRKTRFATAVVLVVLAIGAAGAGYAYWTYRTAQDIKAFAQRVVAWDLALPPVGSTTAQRCPADGLGKEGAVFAFGTWRLFCQAYHDGEFDRVFVWTGSGNPAFAFAASNGWFNYFQDGVEKTVYSGSNISPAPSMPAFDGSKQPWERILPESTVSDSAADGLAITKTQESGERFTLEVFVVDGLLLVVLGDGNRVYFSKDGRVAAYKERGNVTILE